MLLLLLLQNLHTNKYLTLLLNMQSKGNTICFVNITLTDIYLFVCLLKTQPDIYTLGDKVVEDWISKLFLQ